MTTRAIAAMSRRCRLTVIVLHGTESVEFIGASPMDLRTPSVLLEAARDLSNRAVADDDASTCAAVVVLAGVACEAAVSDAFQHVIDTDDGSRRVELRELRRLLNSKKPLTLQPKQQRVLWRAFTNDRLARWEGWIRYVRHVDRCRAVTRTGRLPSTKAAGKREAIEALEIAAAFQAHLEHITACRRSPASLQRK